MGNPSQRDRRLAALARRQFGVFSGPQAISAGYSRWTIDAKARHGDWIRVVGDAYRPATTPKAWQQVIVGAYLTVGEPAAISGRAAMAMWGLSEPAELPQVTVPWTRRPRRSGITVVRTRRWTRVDIVGMGSTFITSPIRTLLDLAPRVAEEELEIALDLAHRKRLIDPKRFVNYLEDAGGIPGAAALLQLVALRSGGRAIESTAETLLFRALRRAGLPLPVPQYWITTRSGRRRVDFAYPNRRLAIEFDSMQIHCGLRALDADSARDNELADLGWERRHITWSMLKTTPSEVAWTIGRALHLEPKGWRDVPREGSQPDR